MISSALEEDLNGSATESIAADKMLGIFDKIFFCIPWCSELHPERPGTELFFTDHILYNPNEDLNGLFNFGEKNEWSWPVSAVLGLRTIEHNQLLVSIAKSKITKHQDEKMRESQSQKNCSAMWSAYSGMLSFYHAHFWDALTFYNHVL